MLKNFDKTTTVQKDGKKYTNNFITCQITCDNEVIADYCVLAVKDNIATVKKGNIITQIELNNTVPEEAINILANTQEEEKEKKTKASKKDDSKKSKGKDQK